MPQSTIKGQDLSKFVIDWIKNELIIEPSDAPENVVSMEAPTPYLWMLYVDGACNSRGLGMGIAILNPIKRLIEPFIGITFLAIKNVEDYKGLLLALH